VHCPAHVSPRVYDIAETDWSVRPVRSRAAEPVANAELSDVTHGVGLRRDPCDNSAMRFGQRGRYGSQQSRLSAAFLTCSISTPDVKPVAECLVRGPCCLTSHAYNGTIVTPGCPKHSPQVCEGVGRCQGAKAGVDVKSWERCQASDKVWTCHVSNVMSLHLTHKDPEQNAARRTSGSSGPC
jgi:hypothetical protein